MGMKTVTAIGYIRSLNYVHRAMIIGIVLFVIVILYLRSVGISPINTSFESTFKFLVPLSAVILIPLGYLFHNVRTQKSENQSKLSEKLQLYQTSLFVKFSLFELPALVALVAYLITGSSWHLIVGLIVFGIFLLNRPTTYNIMDELYLTDEEQYKLTDPNTPVISTRE